MESFIFGPGNGFQTATNVVVVVVVVVVGVLLLSDFQSTKTFPFRNR